MKNNRWFLVIVIGFIVFGLAVGTVISFWQSQRKEPHSVPASPVSVDKENDKAETMGMMVLIEYESVDGLSNMVNELYQRDIYSLLHAGPDFVENNCEAVKKMLDYNVILVGGCGDPLWNFSYDEQLKVMTDTKERIEACTGRPLNFITSAYWGWNEDTVKIAEELGIKNIFARGLVENGAAVFKPEEYDVKILSISNIKSVEFKYGSVCDYSYFVRGGRPSDMLSELDDAIENNEKVTPVSHTNIGGLKKDWFEMWRSFFDSNKVKWASWEEFSSIDYQMPLSQIPINKNVPYTPEMKEGRDELYQESENVENPCAVEELPEVIPDEKGTKNVSQEITMFHNNTGPMCLEAKAFFEENNIKIKEVLNTDDDYSSLLADYKDDFPTSIGVSDSYGYYPFIFTENNGYSGFNDEIEDKLLQEIK